MGVRGLWGRHCQCSHSASLVPWQECLSRLLSPCGHVRSVELQEKPDLAESPKEPKSKFFQPKSVPVGLQVPRSTGMGTWGGARVVSPV
jgi:hypothetical protein